MASARHERAWGKGQPRPMRGTPSVQCIDLGVPIIALRLRRLKLIYLLAKVTQNVHTQSYALSKTLGHPNLMRHNAMLCGM
jgi:hypothetical protein